MIKGQFAKNLHKAVSERGIKQKEKIARDAVTRSR